MRRAGQEAAPEASPEAAPAADAVVAEPEVAERDVPEAPAETASDSDTYTVQSGDTLWKISAAHYGEGSKYMKIFEANSDLLEHPDRIYPGQELSIPNLED